MKDLDFFIQEQKLCGSGVPEELNSGSRALEIEFVADSSIELRGFQLQFRRILLGKQKC